MWDSIGRAWKESSKSSRKKPPNYAKHYPSLPPIRRDERTPRDQQYRSSATSTDGSYAARPCPSARYAPDRPRAGRGRARRAPHRAGAGRGIAPAPGIADRKIFARRHRASPPRRLARAAAARAESSRAASSSESTSFLAQPSVTRLVRTWSNGSSACPLSPTVVSRATKPLFNTSASRRHDRGRSKMSAARSSANSSP